MTDMPPHPGKILRATVFEPINMSVTEAARRLCISRVALSRVLNGKARITTQLALRLEMAGVNTARYWLELQSKYILWHARQRKYPHIERFQMDRIDFQEPL